MALETYRQKRDFRKTAEPSGGGKTRPARPTASGGIFVIQKHDATRLHYDLRLEHDGVLWSWAVTRGPSLDPTEKRLAVHVEDHPIDYAGFEGTIAEGQYGAGTVIVWDDGTWVPEGDPARGMAKGHLKFELKGSKLNGAWNLVRLKPRPGEKRDNWLLIKVDDAFARAGHDILEDAPNSVKSGRDIEEVATGKPAHKTQRTSKSDKTKTARKAKAEKAEMPDFIPPQLATLHQVPPSGDAWLHEVKFDGYRLQAHIENGKVKLLTRNGLDWTGKFGSGLVEAFQTIDCDNAILDGELVALDDRGAASFSRLQAALSEGDTGALLFYAFDMPFLDGASLMDTPLLERKERLKALLPAPGKDSLVLYSEHFHESGKTMLTHACRLGLEGVVSKRADAPYRSGRGGDWIKSKCTLRQEFVIAGYLPSDKSGRGIRSLAVAFREKGVLHYAGRVGTGFGAKAGETLKDKLDSLRVKSSPLETKVPEQSKMVWVRPELVAEVEFRSWTSDRILRQASFQGLREDKPAEEVVAEVPQDEAELDPPAREKKPKSRAGAKTPETSVSLSSADKLLWPEAGVSKRSLLDHYADVWPRMRDYVVNRPLSLVRAPDGIEKQRFFQKHASPGMNEAIHHLKDTKDGEDLLYIEDFDGLAALVQIGVVEVHIWGSTIDALETPDQIIFDIDPDEGLGHAHVVETALEIRRRLEDLGLPSFLKTSGGKGYHVLIPLKPAADWTTVKTFAHDFAAAMEQAEPDLYTATLSKKARAGRIFIDYLRNGRGSTTVCAFSTRARQTASVSVPIAWEQIENISPADFTVAGKALRSALSSSDPWRNYEKSRVRLS